MANKRQAIPDLVNVVVNQGKKFVRYAEGAELYSVGLHTFEQWAKEAEATYRVKGVVLVNTQLIDEFLETFRERKS